ncbi:50S ribosomal protein L21 [Candidatus Magnetomonas plexicatena]|uniref:50S ribosomal protein L21 n=1 Tax=Candidatus Magnetomonas plexicatena TaxID=2552947 RepID=UPI001100C786|nr:50S ribosomal protein L21 [Nitrospirales bacterium LBB_01]
MYAIVLTGGKQVRVTPDETLRVDRLENAVGESVTIDKVLAFFDGTKLSVGKPYLDGVSVKAEILEKGKTKKVDVFKMKPRKATRKMHVHRQHFTKIKINEIIGG